MVLGLTDKVTDIALAVIVGDACTILSVFFSDVQTVDAPTSLRHFECRLQHKWSSEIVAISIILTINSLYINGFILLIVAIRFIWYG